MKKVLIFSFILLWSGLLTGQNIVINNSNLGGIAIPFQDTTITSYDEFGCTSAEYFLDLDQDTFNDIKVYVTCYLGGFGDWFYMTINTFNDFAVHVDTNYQEHIHGVNEDNQIVDTVRTTTVIKKYMWGDTISYNHSSSYDYLYRWMAGSDPFFITNNIDLFEGDTAYIAFTKDKENILSLYYIKVFVPNETDLHLISAKTNDFTNSIDEKKLIANYIFPNPVLDKVHFRGGYNLIEIYSLQGNLVLKENISSSQNVLDVSRIQSGYYIIKFKTDEIEVSTKFIKL